MIISKLKIINNRNDGCFIIITEQPDKKLHVSMRNDKNENIVVIEEIINQSDLYQWVDDHYDW